MKGNGWQELTGPTFRTKSERSVPHLPLDQLERLVPHSSNVSTYPLPRGKQNFLHALRNGDHDGGGGGEEDGDGIGGGGQRGVGGGGEAAGCAGLGGPAARQARGVRRRNGRPEG